MIFRRKTRWSFGLLQMMGMGRRCACVVLLETGTRCPWAFVLETDVAVVKLERVDGWINGWSKILTVVVGDADWISVLEVGGGRPWMGCVGIGDDFLERA